MIYEGIYEEQQNLKEDSLAIIEAQVLVLLNFVKRFFNAQVNQEKAADEFRKADINLLSRFQTLLETSFYETNQLHKKTHTTSYYANLLAIHPNHLNAVVKSITGYTAKQHINNHILRLAKSKLQQTQLSIKEIAYSLYFESPNNFSSFFKKLTNETPNSFRKKSII